MTRSLMLATMLALAACGPRTIPSAPLQAEAPISDATLEDFGRLVDQGARVALQRLQSDGAFYPFALAVTTSGALEPVVAAPPADRPTSDAVIDILRADLHARRAAFRATCILVGGIAEVPGKAPQDAIQARLEHADGTAVNVYVPWARDAAGKIAVEDGYSDRAIPSIFVP